jgi:hypothetical protein
MWNGFPAMLELLDILSTRVTHPRTRQPFVLKVPSTMKEQYHVAIQFGVKAEATGSCSRTFRTKFKLRKTFLLL